MCELIIKKAGKDDLSELLELYTHLHNNPFPAIDSRIENIWLKIMSDKNHNILLGYVDKKLVSSCVIIIIENLTNNQRPYALIENVITHPDYRNKGYASALINHANQIAEDNNCYKIMLMTGSKQENTLKFYENCGFNRTDKTGFIKWI